MTPLDSRTQLVAFALKDARAKLSEPLKKAGVTITVSANRFRVSLAAFNDANDIDRLLSALPASPPWGSAGPRRVPTGPPPRRPSGRR